MLAGPLSPLFVAYSITAVILVVNLMFLWGYSGGVRGGTKVAINAEDAALYKATLENADPPAVARVLRAHANGQATIWPFLLIGLLYALAGGSYQAGLAIFAVFVVARLAHSAFYLAGRQPWRTISFAVSGVALIALVVAFVLCLLRAR